MQTRLTLLLTIITFTILSDAYAQGGAGEPSQANAAPAFMYTSQFEFSDKVYVVKVEKKPTSDIYKYITTIVAAAPAAPAPTTTGAEGTAGTAVGTSTTDGKADTEISYTFKLIELKPDVFRSEFITTIHLFNNVTGVSDSLKKAGRVELLRKEIDRLFYSVVATSFDVEAKAPPAGYMTFDNFKSRGENKEPVVVAHDYFSYYAGIGWSKNKLLESVASNTKELLEARSILKELYIERNIYKLSPAKILDSIDRMFNLKNTEVKKMLTEPQRNYLRSRGFTNVELDSIFREYLSEDKIDPSGIRKPSKQLSVIIEDIQHSIAQMQGEIRRLKVYKQRNVELISRKKTLDSLDKELKMRFNELIKSGILAKEQYNLIVNNTIIKRYTELFKEYNSETGNLYSIINNLNQVRFNQYNLGKKVEPQDDDSLKVGEVDSTANEIQNISNDKIIAQYIDDSTRVAQRIYLIDLELDRLKDNISDYTKVIKTGLYQSLKEQKDKEVKAQDILKDPNLSLEVKNEFSSALQDARQNKEIIEDHLAGIRLKDLTDEAYRNTLSEVAKARVEAQKAESSLKESITPEGVRVHAVQVEFAAGNLKNVMVIGTMRSDEHDREDTIKFVNPHPIPFSAIRDFNYGAQLYSFNHRDPPSNYRYWIHLADVFRYVPAFYVDAEDYSPADVAFTVRMDDKQMSYRVLNRSTVDKLLDARIYSDFVGLDDDTPNGLIQTEVSKRIILRPARHPIILNRTPVAFGGYLNYLEPHAALLKLENKNKFLKLDALSDTIYAANDTALGHTVSRARAIDLLRYANFSIGAKLNLVVFDLPQFKSSFFLDIGTTLYRTSVIDSFGVAREEAGKFVRVPGDTNNIAYTPQLSAFNANSVVSFAELTWQVKPDHRLGFSVSPRISYLDLKSPRFQQVAKLRDDVGDAGGGTPFWMFSVQLNTFILPSENGRLFFRANYTFMYDHQKQDFFQAQLGYAFNILKRKPGQ